MALVTDELDRMTPIVNDLYCWPRPSSPTSCSPHPSTSPTSPTSSSPSRGARRPRLAARADGRRRRDGRPAAADPGDVNLVAQRRRAHAARATDQHRRPSVDGRRRALGARHRPGIAARRAGADLRPLRPRSRRRRRYRRGRARPGDRKAIAEAHGGSVEVDSATRRGHRRSPCRSRLRPQRPAEEIVNRILIAEDEPRIASFLEKGLRADGFTHAGRRTMGTMAASAASRPGFRPAHPRPRAARVWTATPSSREIRGRGERLPVIILTAREGVGDTVDGLEGGADDYVTKPFRFEELLARVRARLRDRRHRRGDGARMRARSSLDLRTAEGHRRRAGRST